MRRSPALLAIALAVGAGSAVVPAAPAAAGTVPLRTYVVTTAAAPDLVVAAAQQLGGVVGFTYRHALTGFSVSLPSSLAPALAALPGVVRVEADQALVATATQSPTPSWGLDRSDQRALPLSNSYTSTAQGAGVTAYVIDTGVRTSHADFGGRATSGYDAIDGGAADDCNGHGTHVAGTVGGTAHGIAKAVSLVAVRVLDCTGSGSTAGVIAGVDWVTAHHTSGPAVANMSLGGGASTTLDNAVKRSIADGISYAVAAGNDGGTLGELLGTADACNGSPSRVPEALTVGATDRNDSRASYSNRGRCLDLFAPGSDITSAWSTSNTATDTISGTSMASPHVAGAAALYLSTAPAATPSQVASAIVAGATTGVVKNPGSGSPNRLLHIGW